MKSISIWLATLFSAAVIPANAATFTVTTNADSGAGSLRDAITLADMSGGTHTINFAGDYTIALTSPLPTINVGTAITIMGLGWDQTIIDGGNPPGGITGVQAFVVSGSLVLDGVGLVNCYNEWDGGAVEVGSVGSFSFINSRAEANTSDFYGGVVFSEGTVVVAGSLITGNQAYQGGGMFLTGTSTIDNTTISANTAGNLGGGGITNHFAGNLTVKGSLFYDNQANNWEGGAIQTWAPSTQTTVENSTFFGNSAPSGGAISCNYSGSVTLRGVTTTHNQATTGGGIWCPDVELEGSIVYRNTAVTGPDLYGDVESLGYNLIGDVSGATINGISAGNVIGVDPLLGPLADNGGMTLTCALPVGSPAIDIGPPGCGGLSTDQRGHPRPVDGNASGTAECDIGAYELGFGIFFDGFESGNTQAWSQTTY